MFKEDDALLEDDPIEFKGGTLALTVDDSNDEKHYNKKPASMCS